MKAQNAKNRWVKLFTVMTLIFAITTAFTGCKKETSTQQSSNTGNETVKTEVTGGSDLKIQKSELSNTVKFYGYKSGDTYMEVLAVKAKDGSIKTAFNTCQVCYSSGKGYYKQKGDTVVCQNCGNVFDIAYIGKARNGCNPVPVEPSAIKDDGSSIVVSKDFLDSSKNLFLKWKK